MRYLITTSPVARLDVDVRGAALQGVEDRRVDELDDRRRSPRSAGRCESVSSPVSSSSVTIWIRNSSVASSSTRCDDSLFLRISWIAVCVPDARSRSTCPGAARARRSSGRRSDRRRRLTGRGPCAGAARSCSGTSGRRGSSGTARDRSRTVPRSTYSRPSRSASARAWSSSDRTSSPLGTTVSVARARVVFGHPARSSAHTAAPYTRISGR